MQEARRKFIDELVFEDKKKLLPTCADKACDPLLPLGQFQNPFSKIDYSYRHQLLTNQGLQTFISHQTNKDELSDAMNLPLTLRMFPSHE